MYDDVDVSRPVLKSLGAAKGYLFLQWYYSPAVRFQTLPLRLKSSILSAVVNFVSACKYLYCLMLIFIFVFKKK